MGSEIDALGVVIDQEGGAESLSGKGSGVVVRFVSKTMTADGLLRRCLLRWDGEGGGGREGGIKEC